MTTDTKPSKAAMRAAKAIYGVEDNGPDDARQDYLVHQAERAAEIIERETKCAAMREVLAELILAASARESTMGDPIRAIDARRELVGCIEAARAALAE